MRVHILYVTNEADSDSEKHSTGLPMESFYREVVIAQNVAFALAVSSQL